jgi:hypothetical protein
MQCLFPDLPGNSQATFVRLPTIYHFKEVKLTDRLQQHIDGKHSDKKDKKFADFFPGYVAA